MRIVAIALNVLLLAFFVWIEFVSVQFARSVDMPLITHIGVDVGRWIFVGATIGPTLFALLRERPGVLTYAFIVNIVLSGTLAVALAMFILAMLLPGTDSGLVLIAVIPATGFLIVFATNVIALRQRLAMRSR